MIGKIGYKRAVVILALLGLLGVLFAVNEWVFRPKVIENQRLLNAAKGEIGTLQDELDRMRADYSQFEKQKGFFDTISRIGFFNDQDRVLARQRFDTMQKLSKIISAKYEIKAANILTNEVPAETGYVVMVSPITVELAAIDDLDIYRFIYYLNYAFPGHITINNFSIERKSEISPETLKSIGGGNPTPLVIARMNLEWRTMALREAIKPDENVPNADGEPTGDAP